MSNIELERLLAKLTASEPLTQQEIGRLIILHAQEAQKKGEHKQ